MPNPPDNAGYVPERGDAVWLDFDPQVGHEQAGRRPALVLSPRAYNQRTGLALFCPITSQIKSYVFEAAIPDGFPIFGVVLTDQIRNLDWRGRHAAFICALPVEVLDETAARLATLLP